MVESEFLVMIVIGQDIEEEFSEKDAKDIADQCHDHTWVLSHLEEMKDCNLFDEDLPMPLRRLKAIALLRDSYKDLNLKDSFREKAITKGIDIINKAFKVHVREDIIKDNKSLIVDQKELVANAQRNLQVMQDELARLEKKLERFKEFQNEDA